MLGSQKSFEKKFPLAVAALKKGFEDQVFPSAQVAVFHKTKIHSYTLNCDENTLFDLASLSKVVSTTTLTAIAVTQHRLKLSDHISEFFPEYGVKNTGFTWEPTILDLLLHRGRFLAWLDFHSHLHTELVGLNYYDEAKINISQTRLKIFQSWQSENEKFLKSSASQNQTSIVYSDLGYILLGWILESAFNMPLDEAFQEFVSLPLGLENLQYLPVDPNIAPTEQCPWRQRLLRGEVHDDNCFALGGVAGHAGLFGTALHMITWSQQWLSALAGETHSNDDQFSPLVWELSSEVAKSFWHTTDTDAQNASVKRALGWDIPAQQGSTAGRLFESLPHGSSLTRGHIGFTGTSLWIDPTEQMIITLLTNRVCPTRHHEKMKAFRPFFHNEFSKDLSNL